MYYILQTLQPNPECWKYENIVELRILRRERVQREPDWCDRPNGHFSEKPVYIVCSYVKFSGKEAEQCCYFKQKVVLLFWYFLLLLD